MIGGRVFIELIRAVIECLPHLVPHDAGVLRQPGCELLTIDEFFVFAAFCCDPQRSGRFFRCSWKT